MLKRKLNVLFAKLFSKDMTKPLECNERQAIIIWNKLLSNPENIAMQHPKKDEYYVHTPGDDPEQSVILSVTDMRAHIVNHHYAYDVTLSHRSTYNMFNKYCNIVEKRRDKFVKKIKENTTHTLNSVIREIDVQNKKIV